MKNLLKWVEDYIFGIIEKKYKLNKVQKEIDDFKNKLREVENNIVIFNEDFKSVDLDINNIKKKINIIKDIVTKTSSIKEKFKKLGL